jgi:hypothetical protein
MLQVLHYFTVAPQSVVFLTEVSKQIQIVFTNLSAGFHAGWATDWQPASAHPSLCHPGSLKVLHHHGRCK